MAINRVPPVIPEISLKERLLGLLDTIRAEVESGEVVSLLALTIHDEENFEMNLAGDLKLTNVAGMLARAQLDALEAMKMPDVPFKNLQ